MKNYKQVKTKSVLFVLIITISISAITPAFPQYYSNLSKSSIDIDSNAENLVLLHSYDFEDNIVGEDPFGTSLWVKEDPADGNVEIANLGDEQQNHVLMQKIERTDGKRVLVRDNVSIYGNTFHAGVISFRVYKHDTSGFEVGITTPNEKLIHIWFWHGQIIDRERYWYVEGDDGYITDHPLNQWFEMVIYFNLSQGWMLDLDGARYGGDYEYEYVREFTADISVITYSSFASGGGSGYARFDDIAFYYYEEEPETSHIYIDDSDPDNDWVHALNQGWCTGSGTWSDPYIIENIIINTLGSTTGSGIFINNSKHDYFIIRNCTIFNNVVGIRLVNTCNGTIINNNCSNNGYSGIELFNSCENNTIYGNTANNIGSDPGQDGLGIYLRNNCINNTISNNTANHNFFCGIVIWTCNNNTIIGNEANGNWGGGIFVIYGSINNIVSGNIAKENGNYGEGGYGITLFVNCKNNTVSGNIVSGNFQAGIHLLNVCVNNTISENNASNNLQYGIYLNALCNNNTISGNSLNENDIAGICLEEFCNDNVISGNTVNNNLYYGIYLNGQIIYGQYQFDDNIISGNIISNNLYYGIYLIGDCDNTTIEGNYLYCNTDLAINIASAKCNDNLVKSNCLVNKNWKFINDEGSNTIFMLNYYGSTPPGFHVDIFAQWFSTTEFIITLNVSREYIGLEILDISFQIWWNGTIVPSENITELGNGLYDVSLEPITVAPDEDPILLNMTISDSGYEEKYFETYIGVDPEVVIKGNTPAGSNVEVIDEITGVNITFSEVTDSGMTTVEKSEEEPDPPSGFEVAGDYYNITTDASYSGFISVAIPYNESKVVGNEENLKIFHWDPSTEWTDVTTEVDTVNNIIYGEFSGLSTFVVMEVVENEYILSEIDQLIQMVNDCPYTCWRKLSNKNAMLNKLIELRNLVYSNKLAKAYDKLLHDIKPKLTGLKTDEIEIPWGDGVFKNPWVTCESFQDNFRLDCNEILGHLSNLFSPLDVQQIVLFSSSLMGLLGITYIEHFRTKKALKLNPFDKIE